jgi:hypothetical protein
MRREIDAAARRRIRSGTLATVQATGRLETRSADLLRAALRAATRAGPESQRVENPADAGERRPLPCAAPETVLPGAPLTAAHGSSGAATAPAENRVERAMALVERIERFVRSGRPALALTLRGRLPGRLEVERVAPGAVALRLSSPRAPSGRALDELRQALEARGLTVRSLETTPP